MKQVQCPGCGIKFPPRTNYTDPSYEEQSSHQKEVEKAMEISSQEIPPSPCIPSLEIRKLRAKLILEEALETIRGLGFYIDFVSDELEPYSGDHITTQDEGFEYHFHEGYNPNLEQIVDGCCDLRVVTTGTLSACGVKDLQPQELVDANNLEKFQWTQEELEDFFDNPEHRVDYTWNRRKIGDKIYTSVSRKDGKYIKPPFHKPPPLEKEIFRQEQKYGINSNKPLL